METKEKDREKLERWRKRKVMEREMAKMGRWRLSREG